MKIVMTTSRIISKLGLVRAGQELDVRADIGKALVDLGLAKRASAKREAPPDTEQEE